MLKYFVIILFNDILLTSKPCKTFNMVSDVLDLLKYLNHLNRKNDIHI